MKVAFDNQPKPLTFGRLVRRLPLYFGLAFVGLAAAGVLVAIGVHFGMRDVSGGWLGFVGYTYLLFWVVVRQGRPHWHRWQFWLVTFSLLITHCSIFVSILRVYPEFRMIRFWPIMVAETGIIGVTIEWLFPETRQMHHRA